MAVTALCTDAMPVDREMLAVVRFAAAALIWACRTEAVDVSDALTTVVALDSRADSRPRTPAVVGAGQKRLGTRALTAEEKEIQGDVNGVVANGPVTGRLAPVTMSV